MSQRSLTALEKIAELMQSLPASIPSFQEASAQHKKVTQQKKTKDHTQKSQLEQEAKDLVKVTQRNKQTDHTRKAFLEQQAQKLFDEINAIDNAIKKLQSKSTPPAAPVPVSDHKLAANLLEEDQNQKLFVFLADIGEHCQVREIQQKCSELALGLHSNLQDREITFENILKLCEETLENLPRFTLCFTEKSETLLNFIKQIYLWKGEINKKLGKHQEAFDSYNQVIKICFMEADTKGLRFETDLLLHVAFKNRTDLADELIERKVMRHVTLHNHNKDGVIKLLNEYAAFQVHYQASELKINAMSKSCKYAYTGRIHQLASDNSSALDCFNKALANEKNLLTLSYRAALYRERGQFDLCKKDVDEVKELHQAALKINTTELKANLVKEVVSNAIRLVEPLKKEKEEPDQKKENAVETKKSKKKKKKNKLKKESEKDAKHNAAPDPTPEMKLAPDDSDSDSENQAIGNNNPWIAVLCKKQKSSQPKAAPVKNLSKMDLKQVSAYIDQGDYLAAKYICLKSKNDPATIFKLVIIARKLGNLKDEKKYLDDLSHFLSKMDEYQKINYQIELAIYFRRINQIPSISHALQKIENKALNSSQETRVKHLQEFIDAPNVFKGVKALILHSNPHYVRGVEKMRANLLDEALAEFYQMPVMEDALDIQGNEQKLPQDAQARVKIAIIYSKKAHLSKEPSKEYIDKALAIFETFDFGENGLPREIQVQNSYLIFINQPENQFSPVIRNIKAALSKYSKKYKNQSADPLKESSVKQAPFVLSVDSFPPLSVPVVPAKENINDAEEMVLVVDAKKHPKLHCVGLQLAELQKKLKNDVIAVVGGITRDLIEEKETGVECDIDIVTSASFKQLKKIEMNHVQFYQKEKKDPVVNAEKTYSSLTISMQKHEHKALNGSVITIPRICHSPELKSGYEQESLDRPLTRDAVFGVFSLEKDELKITLHGKRGIDHVKRNIFEFNIDKMSAKDQAKNEKNICDALKRDPLWIVRLVSYSTERKGDIQRYVPLIKKLVQEEKGLMKVGADPEFPEKLCHKLRKLRLSPFFPAFYDQFKSLGLLERLPKNAKDNFLKPENLQEIIQTISRVVLQDQHLPEDYLKNVSDFIHHENVSQKGSPEEIFRDLVTRPAYKNELKIFLMKNPMNMLCFVSFFIEKNQTIPAEFTRLIEELTKSEERTLREFFESSRPPLLNFLNHLHNRSPYFREYQAIFRGFLHGLPDALNILGRQAVMPAMPSIRNYSFFKEKEQQPQSAVRILKRNVATEPRA